MLTKSDFLKYTQCCKYLWLHKYRQDLAEPDALAAMKRIFDEGYEVENIAYKIFQDGKSAYDADIPTAVANTKKLVKTRQKTIFQPTISNWKVFCRADIIKLYSKYGNWDIYEVKSSTEVKDIHLIDLAFQKICFEDNWFKIGKLFVVYVNKDYIRQGAIDHKKFLKIEDVTRAVDVLIKNVGLNIETAHKILGNKAEPKVKMLKQCHSPYGCEFADHCRKSLPEDSIYDIAGSLSGEKLEALLDRGIIDLKDVPDGIITHKNSINHIKAVKTGQVFIDAKAIKEELAQLEYPLYFLDYETYGPAVPLFDGYKPYQRIIFQYSLHVKKSPNSPLEHYQYLSTKISDPTAELAGSLSGIIGDKGSVIAWNKSFEMGCNREMRERKSNTLCFLNP
ncbi:MAG TPA: DUF2779 domain-containing protein [Candidatus Paceibacterota bacterium]|nr:DUF2779 domain-containing protein [Candidatus Pacearchaeota archaeon]HRZ50386.1 DUF2779 domain-containing protein [Candidatus Paceibacterota bacterium]HSA36107.1 DUF2779 domain-containing protein [Candidatus Paceibacterota bacterium]